MNKSLLVIIAILAVAGSSYFLLAQQNILPEYPEEGSDDQEWLTYKNETFDFTITYPPGWEVGIALDELAPKINIYNPETTERQPPFTHHDALMNVSVFPQGIPTEGVFGKTISTETVDYQEPPRQERTYVLQDGTPWAFITNFDTAPSSWNQSGFLWGRVAVPDLESLCFRDGEEIAQRACDPFFGDELAHRGTVDAQEWETIVRIAESFRFTDRAPATSALLVGDNAIFVPNQPPSEAITVLSAVLKNGGFVVVHQDTNGSPGAIVGSTAYLPPGGSERVQAPLIESAEEGEIFWAMLHSDNGDEVFDSADDLPIRDDADSIIMMPFRIDSSATIPENIAI